MILWHLIFWVRFAYGPQSERLDHRLYWIELVCDALIFTDVLLTFFIGIPSSEAKKWSRLRDKIDLQKIDCGYVYDIKIIAYIYLRTTFFVDLISLLPFIVNWFIMRGNQEAEWQSFYYLKIVRLLFSRSINLSVERIMLKMRQKSSDIVHITASHNYVIMLTLYLKFLLQINISQLFCFY